MVGKDARVQMVDPGREVVPESGNVGWSKGNEIRPAMFPVVSRKMFVVRERPGDVVGDQFERTQMSRSLARLLQRAYG